MSKQSDDVWVVQHDWQQPAIYSRYVPAERVETARKILTRWLNPNSTSEDGPPVTLADINDSLRTALESALEALSDE